MKSLLQLFRHFHSGSSAGHRPHRTATPTRLSIEGLEERALMAANPLSLGAAGQFGVLGINGGQVIIKDSHVAGDIGYAPGETGSLQHADETGTVRIDPTASVDLSQAGKRFLASVSVVSQDLAPAAHDANAAAAAYAALAPTQQLGDVTASTTVLGHGGLNVIGLKSLAFTNQVLTLQGGAKDWFVFNVAGGFSLTNSQMVLAGGVPASQVLFNFVGTGPDVTILAATSVVNGTFLAPQRLLHYQTPGDFEGAVIARDIDFHANAYLHFVPFVCPLLPASISGHVFRDANHNGVMDAGEVGLAGIQVTLTGTDAFGNAVTQTAWTAADGSYSFTGLLPGTYTISRAAPAGYHNGSSAVGSVNGTADGIGSAWAVTNILLGSGDNGVGYNLGEIPAYVPS